MTRVLRPATADRRPPEIGQLPVFAAVSGQSQGEAAHWSAVRNALISKAVKLEEEV